MLLSLYNIYLEDFPRLGYTTIYNLYTKQLGCYTSTTIHDPMNSASYNSMMQKGFVINNQSDETNSVLEYYYQSVRNSNKVSFMLLLTNKCNCNCTYCYQSENNNFADEFSVDLIIEFMNNQIKQLPDNCRIEIIFYGGEPLLKEEIISKISLYMHSFYKDRFFFSIITNGTMLNPHLVSTWSSLGLKVLKITIDGCRESHNKRRKYMNGKPTYDDILTNLKAITGLCELRINTVIDNDVYGYEMLLDEIESNGIHATYSINITEPSDYSISEKSNLYLKFASEIKKRNLFQYVKLSATHGEICQAKICNDYVIDGSGYIFPCNAIFRPIGNVQNYNIEKKQFVPIKEMCVNCKYLPICFGDCPYNTQCQKEYFEYFIPKILKVYIR